MGDNISGFISVHVLSTAMNQASLTEWIMKHIINIQLFLLMKYAYLVRPLELTPICSQRNYTSSIYYQQRIRSVRLVGFLFTRKATDHYNHNTNTPITNLV